MDYEFRDYETTGLFRVQSGCYIPSLVQIGRTVSKLFIFFVNFSFPSAAILDFEKNGGFGTSDVWRVRGRSSMPNLVKIGNQLPVLCACAVKSHVKV